MKRVLQAPQDMIVAGARTLLVEKEKIQLFHDLFEFEMMELADNWMEDMKTTRECHARRLFPSEIFSVCYIAKYKSSISYYLKELCSKIRKHP